jgi:hypothetical protein
MAITYSISGGADQAKFNINSSTGKLTFKAAPDYESPGDANRDNVYEVTVKATDAGGASSTKDVRVTVTDVSENLPPQITSAGAVSVAENQTTVMTITAVDPDDGGTPVPPDPPPSGDWPDDSNTGVPAGTQLTNYTGPKTITAANTVIDSKTINGGVEVTTSGVTFRKCKFTGDPQWHINGDTARDMTIEDCTFEGSVKAILAQGIMTRLNISRTIIGITLKDGKSTIRDCYIHDLDAHAQPSDPHFDGIFIAGGQRDCLVEHCHINIPGSGGTASIFIATRWQGSNIVNTTVNNCKLMGTPSYAMYNEQTDVATITGTKWTNNVVHKGAYGGYWVIQNSTVVKQGNVDAETGANIDNK